jgi:hypothetical protein
MFSIKKITSCENCPIKEDYDFGVLAKQGEIEDLKMVLLESEKDLNLVKQENAYLKEAFKKFGCETARQKVIDYVGGLELAEHPTGKIIHGSNPANFGSLLSRSDYTCKTKSQNKP